ncbi:MAG: PKD domain-containing protein [Ignavibacteriaceae bacterium]|nr:PKD domain-containing protein [Ignavibacteriaceae bacterium]
MIKIFYYFLLIISFIVVSGCNKSSNNPTTPASTTSDPVSAFSFSGSNLTPSTITFQNTSLNADSYAWDFGDGTSSSQENPSKVYSTVGTYTVILKATESSSGKSNQISHDIKIVPGSVYLQKVTVALFPYTDSNGNPWELLRNPYLYYSVIDSVRTNKYTAPSYFDVAPSGLPVTWTVSPELQFLSWNKTYFIDLWDYQLVGNNKEIGNTLGFRINDQVNANYPTTVTLLNTSGSMKVILTLDWK